MMDKLATPPSPTGFPANQAHAVVREDVDV